MKIRILCVGHLKEKYWSIAQEEYLRRLSPFAETKVEEIDDISIPENASSREEEEVKAKEGERLLSRLKPSDFVILLDLGEKEIDSITLSSRLQSWLIRGGSHITFVIGGSLGLSEEVKKRGNAVLTLSQLTFTHQMARIILLEQLYRSFKILHHEPYHK